MPEVVPGCGRPRLCLAYRRPLVYTNLPAPDPVPCEVALFLGPCWLLLWALDGSLAKITSLNDSRVYGWNEGTRLEEIPTPAGSQALAEKSPVVLGPTHRVPDPVSVEKGLRTCISYRLQADAGVAGLLTTLRRAGKELPCHFSPPVLSDPGHVTSPSRSTTRVRTLRTQSSHSP